MIIFWLTAFQLQAQNKYPYYQASASNNYSSLFDSKPSYKTKSKVALRSGISENSKTLKMIPSGATVKVISSFGGNWWEVFYRDKIGYIKNKDLSFEMGNNKVLDDRFTSSLYESHPSYRCNTNAAMRERKSESSAIITYISKGSELKVIHSVDPIWWEVYYRNKIGYVKKGHLDFLSTAGAPLLRPSEYSDNISPHIFRNKPGIVTRNVLEVRTALSKHSSLLILIPTGVEVKILSYINEYWTEIYYEGKRGYVLTDDLKYRRPTSHSKSKKAAISPKYDTASYVLVKRTSLRLEADSQSMVLMRLSVGEKVTVVEQSHKWWWKVDYYGQSGWIKAACLSKL